MKINKNSLVLAAAFSGLLGGTMARFERGSGIGLIALRRAAGGGQLGQKGSRKACLQGIELLQGQWRRVQEGVGQELLQG